jgi:hypothetical protein
MSITKRSQFGSVADLSCCHCCRLPVVPPGLVTNDAFLAGYGGCASCTRFTCAAYLGGASRRERRGGRVVACTIQCGQRELPMRVTSASNGRSARGSAGSCSMPASFVDWLKGEMTFAC